MPSVNVQHDTFQGLANGATSFASINPGGSDILLVVSLGWQNGFGSFLNNARYNGVSMINAAGGSINNGARLETYIIEEPHVPVRNSARIHQRLA